MVPEFAALRGGSFRDVNPRVVASLGSPHVKNLYREHLAAIVRAQRALIFAYLALTALGVAGATLLLFLQEPARAALAIAVQVALSAVLAIFMARLAAAMQIAQWPWVLAACFPCFSLFALLTLMWRANHVLTQAGVPVGLLGGRLT
jgi:hypothetical protein